MIVKIYDMETREAIAACTKIINMHWERYFYSIGKFEFECSKSDESVEYLQQGRLVIFDGKAGIILYRHSNNKSITIKGYDLKYFCRARIIIPPFVYKSDPQPIDGYERIKGNAETVIKFYADRQMINPKSANIINDEYTVDETRKIKNLVCAEDKQRGDSLAWQAKFTQLDEELENICKYAKMGYDIAFDVSAKQFVFDVAVGTNRTISQTDNAPVIFCEEYRNISQIEYTDDFLNAKNVVYVGANGDEEEQFVLSIPSESLQSDFMRVECYTEVSSSDTDEIEDGGAAYLDNNKKSETVSGDANSMYKYKTDWNLGDYVTAKIKAFGTVVTVDEQIIGVKEVYKRDSVSVTPIFSENNLLKKIISQRS